MKESIIIFIILFLVIAGSVFSEKYLEKTSNSIIEDIINLKNKMANIEDVEKVSNDIKKVYLESINKMCQQLHQLLK